MPLKRKLQVSVDLLMLILLPLLMAYSLIGEAAHEWLGMAMLVLFVAHHILNRQWIRNLFRGKYTPARIFGTILNFLLAVTMIAMPVSGIIMGNHAVPWLHLSSGTALAREVHLPAAYWGYLWMSLHLGLHWNRFLAMGRNLTEQAGPSHRRTVVLRLLDAVVVLYGLYAFFKRQFPDYLLLRMHFVFFNYEEPLAMFFVDYLAIMGLFASAGYYLFRLLNRKSKSTVKNKSN